MVAEVLLLGLLAVATATDLWRHRIYNWTTYPGILAALGMNALGAGLLRGGLLEEATLRHLGWIGLAESALGFLICGGVMLVCYVLLQVGGGDVKLIAMLGAFLGQERGVETMLWTFVLGACLGLIVLVWRVGPLRLIASVGGHLLWMLRLGRFQPLTPEQRAALEPPLFLAPSAMAAAVIVQFGLL
jgi:Flp pilus assembly protein protease CpaA